MSPFMLKHGVVRRAVIIKLALNSSPLFFTVMSMSSRSEYLPIMCFAFIKRECNPWIWQTTGVPKSSFFYIFLLGKKPKVGEI